MRILCVGGGSGGHITPIAAIVSDLRKEKPCVDTRVWCDRKFVRRTRQLIGRDIRVSVIVSGKYRRYANLSFASHVRYHLVKTHLANFVDVFKVGFGFLQSFFKLIVWRPSVIFCKGGFVCVPVGLAARMLRIPLVIHDSDSVPGLANRILARYASRIGTGLPIENYPNYKKDITKYVGIPVRQGFKVYNAKQKAKAKENFGFLPNKKLVVVVGGGLGSRNLNQAALDAAPNIVEAGLQMLIVSGADKPLVIDENLQPNVREVSFIADRMPELLGAADIVVTRAGAAFLAELAAVAASIIIVPNRHLAGDHQTKNADIYKTADAALVIDSRELEKSAAPLADSILRIANDDSLNKKLSQNLHKFAKPDALEQMIKMILGVAKQ
ncbi:MAG: glycosyltransferase [Candidatus Nomurabacteria bacterium]|nr:glycosyltransferase [Candidatus Nomurabacteria bacterium]